MRQLTKYLYGTLAALAFAACFTSCNKDLGNYKYEDITAVYKIEDIPDTARAESGSTLKLTPKISFAEGNNLDDFIYTWYWRKGNDAVKEGTWEELQKGKDLEVAVADPIGTPAKTYSLAFEMLNKKTGIPYRKVFKLSVESPFNLGFAALCETEEGFDIDMIALSSDSKLIQHKNILETSGSELLRQGVKPRDIICFNDKFAPNPFAFTDPQHSVYILTDQYTTRIKPTDYSWKKSYDVSNIVENGSHLDRTYVKQGKPVIADKMVNGFINNTARLYMHHKEENGETNWYFYADNMAINLFAPRMNGFRSTDSAKNGERFQPAPHVAVLNTGVMYFNLDNNQFVYGTFMFQQNYLSTNYYYAQALGTEPEGMLYKFNDPDNAELIHMGTSADFSTARRGYAIVKRKDGTFRYMEFQSAQTVLQVTSTPAVRTRFSAISADSRIDDAKFFARAHDVANNPFLYYVTNDNKVMKVDVSLATAVVTDITSQVLKGDGYNEITAFRYALPEATYMPNAGSNAAGSLAVGTYNSSLGKDAGGKLEFFTPSSGTTGDLVVTKYPNSPAVNAETGEEYQIDMSWTGMGRIVGLTYKSR